VPHNDAHQQQIVNASQMDHQTATAVYVPVSINDNLNQHIQKTNNRLRRVVTMLCTGSNMQNKSLKQQYNVSTWHTHRIYMSLTRHIHTHTMATVPAIANVISDWLGKHDQQISPRWLW